MARSWSTYITHTSSVSKRSISLLFTWHQVMAWQQTLFEFHFQNIGSRLKFGASSLLSLRQCLSIQVSTNGSDKRIAALCALAFIGWSNYLVNQGTWIFEVLYLLETEKKRVGRSKMKVQWTSRTNIGYLISFLGVSFLFNWLMISELALKGIGC
jgi:hypothetical protein